ncbi:MAG: hypothetical protein K5989_07770 [Lachnospiraceae bacterium]|nr:hypothetical protein [Lachnospiraceae bacterium]
MDPFDELFDYNRDGKLDFFEKTAQFDFNEEMLRRTRGDDLNLDDDLGLDEDDLGLDEDDLGLDEDDLGLDEDDVLEDDSGLGMEDYNPDYSLGLSDDLGLGHSDLDPGNGIGLGLRGFGLDREEDPEDDTLMGHGLIGLKDVDYSLLLKHRSPGLNNRDSEPDFGEYGKLLKRNRFDSPDSGGSKDVKGLFDDSKDSFGDNDW